MAYEVTPANIKESGGWIEYQPYKKEVKPLDIKTFKEFKNLTSDEKAIFIIENPDHGIKLLVLWLKELEKKIK